VTRFRIGIRWWLGLAFALIAAVTALTVASLFADRSADEFRARAKELVAGSAFVAAQDVDQAVALKRPVGQATERAADLHRLALFVFDQRLRLITPRQVRGVTIDAVEYAPQELRRVITRGERFIHEGAHSEQIVVLTPVAFGALVAQGSPPELSTELGIVRNAIVEAALVAVGVGALVGLIVATLISVRLRRIARAAAEIERGNFETSLRPRFRDELGDLGRTVDRMRERLRESFTRLEFERDRLHRLLERLHEGVVTVDRDLVVQFANGEAARVLGVPGLAEGAHLPEPWPEFSLRDFAAGLFSRDAAVAQTRVTLAEERVCIVIGVPGTRRDPAILVVADATEQERRELAEREFVANASHELRTPLTTILGAVDVLQSGAKDEPAQRDRFLNLIEREAGRLARLARALLVLARAQTREELPSADLVELGPLLEEIAAGVHPPPDVALEVECDAGVVALADRDLAEQAIRNVVENAAKHTDRGRIVLRAARHNGAVHIAVADTGRGIPPETSDRVFDRFYRAGARDADGFGLGLAIVREAVRALGGSVDLRSAPNAGTTVTITLPAAERRQP
jgi:two-component system sensor histidine kinase VicK